MKKILHVVSIRAPRTQIYEALTTAGGLSRWWTTEVDAEGGEGGLVDFRFRGDFNPDMKVTRLEPDAEVHWRCVGGHDNWRDNTFAFELTDEGEGARLMFTQVYAQELDDVTYGVYNYNWGYYLGSLKAYCETGTGTPFEA